ncbi:MAG: hypothetical protein MUP47_01115 [Phycisphaerae bacterium]|nr:hypothetical protein [Phycisphaerae bacterium]
MKKKERERKKKERERWYLNRFKEIFPSFPEGGIEESEDPDFLLGTSREGIGIEITNLYRSSKRRGGSLLKRQDSLREQVLREAKRIWDDESRGPILVYVHFNDGKQLCNGGVKALAHRLVELVGQHSLAVGASGVANWKSFPKEGLRVAIYRHARMQESYWLASQFVVVPALSFELVQAALREKDSKCTEYRKKCSELWLLLVVDGSSKSSMFFIPETIAQTPFEAQFDRAFLYCDSDRKYWQLSLSRRETDRGGKA